MPAVQTSYSENQGALRVGQIVDTTDNTLISRNVEVAALGFGLPVVQGADDRGAWKAKTGDTKILGITVRERSQENDEWAVGDTARIMTKGTIAVTASVEVSAGDPVTVVVATAAFSNTGGVAIPNATYQTSGGVGDVVEVKLA